MDWVPARPARDHPLTPGSSIRRSPLLGRDLVETDGADGTVLDVDGRRPPLGQPLPGQVEVLMEDLPEAGAREGSRQGWGGEEPVHVAGP